MQKVSNKICGRCGGTNLISDRSLGGKIVCVKCGSSFIKTRSLISSPNRNFYYFFLVLVVIFFIVIF
tara:strand:- start:564 stop:764 length:201 start_codon:yes stop_codon:yes gene_type:complete